MEKKYVVGFLFTSSLTIALTKKIGGWQDGKWNGIGGKIELGEPAYAAMVRESIEEIGLDLHWTPVGVMQGKNNDGNPFKCFIFYHQLEEMSVLKLPSHTDVGEEIQIFDVRYLPVNIIGNLSWIIPLIFDMKNGEHGPKFTEINY